MRGPRGNAPGLRGERARPTRECAEDPPAGAWWPDFAHTLARNAKPKLTLNRQQPRPATDPSGNRPVRQQPRPAAAPSGSSPDRQQTYGTHEP